MRQFVCGVISMLRIHFTYDHERRFTNMVSITGRSEKVYVCLSTDEKPTGASNGSILYEMDTKTFYMYDAENEEWCEM